MAAADRAYEWTVTITQTADVRCETPEQAFTAACAKLGIKDPTSIVRVEATKPGGPTYTGSPA